MDAHQLSGLFNVLVPIILLSLGLGPRRVASLARMAGRKLMLGGTGTRKLAKQASLMLNLGLWR